MVDGSYQPIQSEDEIRRRLADVDHVFIHIPKTAGGSIQAWVGDQYATGHITSVRLREILGDAKWDRMFKFAVVRNPFDRLVSWFHHHRQHIPFSSFQEWVKAGLPVDWANEWHGNAMENDPLTLRTWVCDFENRLHVNKIIKFEDLANGCSDLSSYISKEYRGLDRRNATTHDVYWRYYDKDTRDIVSERFAGDLETFDYAF